MQQTLLPKSLQENPVKNPRTYRFFCISLENPHDKFVGHQTNVGAPLQGRYPERSGCFMPSRILIADDSPSVRSALRHLLETSAHWEITEAEDGRQAIAKAHEISPNVIVLDLVMPVMDGLAAARELTRLLPEIPLVLYTMHWSAQVQLEAQKAGARRVVAKTDSKGLVAAIQELLASEPSDAGVRALPPISSSAVPSAVDPNVVVACPVIEPAIIESSIIDAGIASPTDNPDSPAAEKPGDATGNPPN